ncbi:MAG TPA: MSHA biogenesis protein MshJ [Methylophilaceae bacterium]|jgi:MSHA biogenesis protein MshJ
MSTQAKAPNQYAEQWQQALSKFEALSQRERWLVFLAGAVVIYTLLNMLLISPITSKQNALSAEISQSQTQMAAFGEQISALKQNPVVDVDTQNTKKIQQLKTEIQQQNQTLANKQHELISPDNMPKVLSGLLQKNTGVRLLAMKTLTTERVLLNDKNEIVADANGDAANNQSLPNGHVLLYKHGLEVTIAGEYFDLMRYVQTLEHLPMRVMWSKADLRAKEYPQNELTITVYTLSLDKTWLSI